MKKQLSMLAILVGASLNAQAAQSSFFTITEVGEGYATGISADNSVLTVTLKNDAGNFFSTAPFSDFLVDRFRFEQSCVLSGDVCDAFWEDNAKMGFGWRRDFLDATSQRDNVGIFGSEADGLALAMGPDSGTYVGYKATKNAVNGLTNSRTGFAVINNLKPVFLDGNYKANGTNVLSSATSISLVSGSQYLVTGTAATGLNRKVDTDEYRDCFSGDDEQHGHYLRCPGIDTQAAFWLVDNGAATLFQPASYYNNSNDMAQTASATQAVKQKDGSWVAVGYSATNHEEDEHSFDLATYWSLDLTNKSAGETKAIPLAEGKPDSDDASLRASWATGVNTNGYIIGNQRYRTNKSQNRPVEMFIFNLSSPASNASVPLKDKPINGANSEAAAINDHNMVVGWRDSRHQTQPVANGTNRMQEAFLLNAAAPNNSWYLNDLICGLDDAGAKQCAQKNGYYYHIAYASGISTDGTISATAYRYASESDLNNRANATVVAVKLAPAIKKDYEGNDPASYVVSNEPVKNQTGQDGEGGGGGSLFWLTLLALPFAWLRRHPR